MKGEEAKPLQYVPETVLKKRKKNEEWAVRRRERLEDRKKSRKEDRKFIFRRLEHFVREYRSKEIDLIKLKQRQKQRKPLLRDNHGPKLLFVIRINGKKDMHRKIKKDLYLLRLRHIYSGVFVKASEQMIDALRRVEPYVTYGNPNPKSVKELIFKKGYGNIERQKVPLTDNNIIEEALGKYGIICIEDIVHELINTGPHFKEVIQFLWPFKLNKLEGDMSFKKKPFRHGGDAGNRGEQINDLISRMN